MKYEDTEGFINYHKNNKHYPIILSIDEGYETKLEIFKGMLEDVLNKQLDKNVFKDSIQITIDKRDLTLNSYTSVKVREDEIHMCFKDIDIDMLEEYLETLVYNHKSGCKPKSSCKPKNKELIADTLYPMDVGLGGPCEDTSDRLYTEEKELYNISSDAENIENKQEVIEELESEKTEDKQEVMEELENETVEDFEDWLDSSIEHYLKTENIVEDNEESIPVETGNKIQSIDCIISMTDGEFYDIKHLTKDKLISLLEFLDAK